MLNRNLVIATLAVHLFGAGCKEDHSAAEAKSTTRVVSATKPAAHLGEEATTPHFGVRVLNTKPCGVEAHLEPPPGVRKFAVELELRGLGGEEVPVNPFYATLSDQESRRYESTLAGCSPLLRATRLRAGETARGWVTFDVPEAAQPVSLIYQPVILGFGPQKVELLLQP